MFRRREEIRERLTEIIAQFKQKALPPQKKTDCPGTWAASTLKQAIHRRLGQSGIFVEVNEKYYLSEERLNRFRKNFFQNANNSFFLNVFTLKIENYFHIPFNN
jgi:hypothetical protein